MDGRLSIGLTLFSKAEMISFFGFDPHITDEEVQHLLLKVEEEMCAFYGFNPNVTEAAVQLLMLELTSTQMSRESKPESTKLNVPGIPMKPHDPVYNEPQKGMQKSSAGFMQLLTAPSTEWHPLSSLGKKLYFISKDKAVQAVPGNYEVHVVKGKCAQYYARKNAQSEPQRVYGESCIKAKVDSNVLKDTGNYHKFYLPKPVGHASTNVPYQRKHSTRP